MNIAMLQKPPVLARAVRGLKAISHPGRLKLLCALRKGEKTVGELAEETGLSQSSTSQHLAKMTHGGILSNRRDGVQIYYAVADARHLDLIETLCSIYGDSKS